MAFDEAGTSRGYVWDTNTLSWVRATGGGGGGGGAVTVADGADIAEGSTADVAWSGVGSGSVIAVLKKIASSGGSAVSVADGSDVAEGATTDAAVITDATGTLSGKLRGLVKIFADIWDGANHWLRVSVQNTVAAVPLVTGSASATFNGFVSDLVLALPTGTRWVMLTLTQGATPFNGSIGFKFSVNGGVSYVGADGITTYIRNLTSPVPYTPLTLDGSETANVSQIAVYGPFPQNATHVALAVAAYTAGSMVVTFEATAWPLTDQMLNLALSGNNTGGVVTWGGANLIVGGVDSGTATHPVQVSNSGSVSQFDPLLKTAIGNTSTAAAFNVRDKNANGIDSSTAALGGAERGLVVREVSEIAPGATIAPAAISIVGGKTADGTPQYQPVPLTTGGAAVAVSLPAAQVTALTPPSNVGYALDASLATIDADIKVIAADLGVVQGAQALGVGGNVPLAKVSDARESYVDTYLQPLSLTSDGRLRVEATSSNAAEIEFFGALSAMTDPEIGVFDWHLDLFA